MLLAGHRLTLDQCFAAKSMFSQILVVLVILLYFVRRVCIGGFQGVHYIIQRSCIL